MSQKRKTEAAALTAIIVAMACVRLNPERLAAAVVPVIPASPRKASAP